VAKHSIVIVGAGTAGTTVAARLRRAGAQDVALVDPAPEHYYQPLWTLVGGGLASASASVKPRSKTIPDGVTWIRAGATAVDPEARTVTLDNGEQVGYEQLVVAPGIQLNWGKVEGLEDTLGSNGVSSNYRYDLAPKTWNLIKGTKSGTAIFTQPAGPIKCAGAPQKIAYLAADYWKSQGILDDIDVHLVLPTPGMFGIKHFADQLYDIATKRYGITVHFDSDLKAVVGPGLGAEPRSRRRPVRLHRDRQEHDAARAVPGDLRPRRRRLEPELEDRRSGAQAGAGCRRQPPRHGRGSRPGRQLRRVRVVSAHHRPQQAAPRRVRLLDAADPVEPAAVPGHHTRGHRLPHVQEGRTPRALLELHAQGHGLTR
jgi:Pyridine nucleotide-disulphide oxidoreductase